jgi:hypothetical protein
MAPGGNCFGQLESPVPYGEKWQAIHAIVWDFGSFCRNSAAVIAR